MKDYVIYIDTDSLFFSIEEFALDAIGEKWETLSDKEKEEYSIEISKCIEDYVNEQSFSVTQNEIFNSAETEFKINFKQEIIAKTALFTQKKKYSLFKINEQGISVQDIHTRGLDTVKSNCPDLIKTKLKDITKMVLDLESDKTIEKYIIKSALELYNASPIEISTSLSVNNLSKYLGEGIPKKGTPWHLKGVYNYHKCLKLFKIEDTYERIFEGEKVRVVYLKENKYNMECLSFFTWPKEIEDNGLKIDYDKMIIKFFIEKLDQLLEPIGKADILKSIKEVYSKNIKKKKRKKKDEEEHPSLLGV